MSAEELENYETDAQLALYREYRDVMSLFTHAVDTDRRFYLANHVEVIPRVSDGTVYFEVLMSDVWVWDVFRTNRFVKTVRVLSTHDVNVEERLPNQEFSIPDMGVRTLFDAAENTGMVSEAEHQPESNAQPQDASDARRRGPETDW